MATLDIKMPRRWLTQANNYLWVNLREKDVNVCKQYWTNSKNNTKRQRIASYACKNKTQHVFDRERPSKLYMIVIVQDFQLEGRFCSDDW